MSRRAVVGSAAALAAACMSAHDIGNAKGEGETRCYVAPYDVLWPAAEGALRSLVITSYSIHYTKLYDAREDPARSARRSTRSTRPS